MIKTGPKSNVHIAISDEREEIEEYEWEDEEFEEESNEEDEEEEDEEEDETEIKIVKKRRCQRRKKIRQICFDSEDEVDEEEDEEFNEGDEDEEEEEGDEEDIESYIPSTGSSVFSAITFEWENEIYEFEELCDPGNINTIYRRYYDEPNLYDDIGELRYLHVCRILSITPMIRFLQALHTSEIDLSYRQINGKNIRAICAALEINTTVRRLILRYNKLLKADCSYLAIMLHHNEGITFLDLTGCGIGPQGIEEYVTHLARNEVLTDVILSKCKIQDEGMKLLSNILSRNNSLQTLDLSYNELGDEAAEALGFALKMNKSIKNLNLKYNNLYDPVGMKMFFRGMTVNDSITHLNLAWNAISSPEIGGHIGTFLRKNETILYLDLSDNRLEGAAILEIKRGLGRSKSLETIKLSRNPMSPEDLDFVLSGAKNCSTLSVLELEDLWVKKSFIKNLKKIRLTREIEVKIGGMYGDYEVRGPDYAKVILERAQFEAMKPKKKKLRKDFGHLIWTLGEEPLTEEQFMTLVKKFKAKINKELFPELIKQFIIPKAQLIDVVAMKEKYLSLFPDSTPPPPPKVKGKGKRKGKEPEPERPTETKAPPVEKKPKPVAGVETEPGEEDTEEEQLYYDDGEEEDIEEVEASKGEEEENINIEILPEEVEEVEEEETDENVEEEE